jgi:protein phosphatase
MVTAGSALCVPGNHDIKLYRKLMGRDVQVTHGLDRTLAEIDALPDAVRADFSKALAEFIDSLVSHYVFDGGKLVVAHAGLREDMQGRGSGKVREFALYGETTGETDEFGLPVRFDWASEYGGSAMVVYGHTPVPEPEWLNRTINIDTGCVFGGRLTALRYPEKEFLSVPARHTYCQPRKPFIDQPAPVLSAQHEHDDVLDIGDFLGKFIVSTRLGRNVTIREENALAALEVMSRFAVNPKWMIYLPPTMSPCETSQRPDLLEHPAEAFAYYRHEGVPCVMCEEKHMGSRAVVIVARDEGVITKQFGIAHEGIGACYTRTGRRFFKDLALEAEFLGRVRSAVERANLWEALKTAWLCLDCELMPWSVKAQELIREHYAAVGAASSAALPDVVVALAKTAQRTPEADLLLERYQARAHAASHYSDAYRRYCWQVQYVDDIRLAPFHVLASEDAVHVSKDHGWHMQTIARLCNSGDKLLLATPHRIVDVTDEADQAGAVRWWEELTARGGEGMVVKPLDFVAKGRRGPAQPALKVRGREYLRIIYGPEYTLSENLDRLRTRGLAAKRSLALREFALGVEALERFVRREPLRRVHECVFAILALESEPVDPRL